MTSSLNIALFCGVPRYKVNIYDTSGVGVVNQILANVTSKPSNNFDKFELGIQTSDFALVGRYQLIVTAFLYPGTWSYKDYKIALTVVNPCQLNYFNFDTINFGFNEYSISSPK